MEIIKGNVTGNAQANGSSRRPPPALEAAISYRINDASAVCGLSGASLYRLMSEGKLKTVLVAGRRLVPADELRRLINAA